MESIKNIFYLDKEVTFLNHGSFGACSKPVMAVYQNWQLKLEKQPVAFLGRHHADLLQKSREALSGFVGCDTDELVYVTNASVGLNIVANSLAFSTGDEVLSTNLEYGAMDRMWKIVCERAGANYVRAKIQLPIKDERSFFNDIWSHVNKKTRVVFLSHITSSTALLLPLKQLVDAARKKGIITIIDGAHVPGQINLDLHKLDCDFYTGNCHKWLMAPKGAAFLYARKSMQKLLKAFMISWGRDEFLSESAFIDEFEYQGTRDISPFLTVPAAIDFHNKYFNKPVKEKIQHLLNYAKSRLESILKTKSIVNFIPENMQMYAHPLPENIDGVKLKLNLYEQFKIEIPISRQNGIQYIRISIQIYNNKQEIDYFLTALKKLVG